jgi:hypothetical protein
MNNRSRIHVTDTMHMSFFVLFGVTAILTESQETIPKGHCHRVKQIRSDHLVLILFVVVVGELRPPPEPPGTPSFFYPTPKFYSPL